MNQPLVMPAAFVPQIAPGVPGRLMLPSMFGTIDGCWTASSPALVLASGPHSLLAD
jgi:hypothetical protein